LKQIKSKSVSLLYDPRQDRLQWISQSEENQLILIQITRRMFIKVLPILADWLNKYSIQTPENKQDAESSQVQTDISLTQQHEHYIAQQQVSISQGVMSDEIQIDDSFLLYTIRLGNIHQDRVRLTLIDEQDSIAVQAHLSLIELHKIIGELLKMSDLADWKVINPWQQTGDMKVHMVGNQVMH